MATRSRTLQFDVLPQITLPLDGVPFEILRLTGMERVSSLFSFDVDITPLNQAEFAFSDVPVAGLIGQEAAIELQGGAAGSSSRFVHGVISQLAAVPFEEAEFPNVYRLRIVPWLALWDLKSSCRIWEDVTAMEVVSMMIDDWGKQYRAELPSSFRVREYCCQLEETDFNFFSRLLEEEGIFYYFVHGRDSHLLVLADKNNFRAVDGPEKATYGYSVMKWRSEFSLHSGQFNYTDFDPVSAERVEGTESTLIEIGGNDRLTQFHFPANVVQDGEARHRARIAVEREECRHAVHHGVSLRRDFSAGHRFVLKDDDDSQLNGEYLLLSVRHSFDKQNGYRNAFTCIPNSPSGAYRPPLTAARPAVAGPQTALVVDDESDPQGLGRVRVRFHWARDEQNSCWLRVAEMMAGERGGTWFRPRTDQEVIVVFLHGDPDRPVVTGRLYNGRNLPAEDSPEVTSIQTAQGQQLRFDDRAGQQHLMLKAIKDLEIFAKTGELTIKDGAGNVVQLSPSGLSITSAGKVVVQAGTVDVSAGMVTINAGMTQASGVLKCDTLIATAVISTSYTPGAGNIW